MVFVHNHMHIRTHSAEMYILILYVYIYVIICVYVYNCILYNYIKLYNIFTIRYIPYICKRSVDGSLIETPRLSPLPLFFWRCGFSLCLEGNDWGWTPKTGHCCSNCDANWISLGWHHLVLRQREQFWLGFLLDFPSVWILAYEDDASQIFITIITGRYGEGSSRRNSWVGRQAVGGDHCNDAWMP